VPVCCDQNKDQLVRLVTPSYQSKTLTTLVNYTCPVALHLCPPYVRILQHFAAALWNLQTPEYAKCFYKNSINWSSDW